MHPGGTAARCAWDNCNRLTGFAITGHLWEKWLAELGSHPWQSPVRATRQLASRPPLRVGAQIPLGSASAPRGAVVERRRVRPDRIRARKAGRRSGPSPAWRIPRAHAPTAPIHSRRHL